MVQLSVKKKTRSSRSIVIRVLGALLLLGFASLFLQKDTGVSSLPLSLDINDFGGGGFAPQKVNGWITDSSASTVISFAVGYGISSHKQYVGSLRSTGYKGHIIIAIQPNPPSDVVQYLKMQNVTTKVIEYTNCTHGVEKLYKNDGTSKCIVPFTDIKMRWAKYPLGRKWLLECPSCTGPVLISDFRDLYFQRDPFLGVQIDGLQVFEEHQDLDTRHWIVSAYTDGCKGITFPAKPMLCSGTTVGTRQAMLDYLESMHNEMKVWMKTPSCQHQADVDDQAMHDYLFYYQDSPNALRNAIAIKNQQGIVNTIGYQAARVWEKNEKVYHAWQRDQKNVTAEEKAKCDFLLDNLGTGKNWLSRKLTDENNFFHMINGQLSPWNRSYLTDEEGFLLDMDGQRSRVVHQVDRFGFPFIAWLNKQPYMQ